MKNEKFNELVASIEEAGKIKRGEQNASRVTEFSEPDVKAIRENTGFSQSRFTGINRRYCHN